MGAPRLDLGVPTIVLITVANAFAGRTADGTVEPSCRLRATKPSESPGAHARSSPGSGAEQLESQPATHDAEHDRGLGAEQLVRQSAAATAALVLVAAAIIVRQAEAEQGQRLLQMGKQQ